MPIKQSIAAKIFGLAVFLSILTIGLVGFLLREVIGTAERLRVAAELDIPLTQSLSSIHEYGLRRRLAFERWFGALNAAQPNAEIVSEAMANYAGFSDLLTKEFATARRLLGSYSSTVDSRESIARIRTLLDQIEPAYPLISRRQHKVIELQLAGEHTEAQHRIDALNDLQRMVQSQREVLQRTMEDQMASSALAVATRERRVVWLTLAATISTVLLGLVIAALVAQRVTRPIRTLASAMRDVQGGNLEVQVPVSSADEVGKLSESFNFFVHELRSKSEMKRTFGKYVDPRILDRLLAGSGSMIDLEERHRMTILFADIVGFASLSERLTPALMVKLLNRHFGLQARVIQQHQGIVDKFLGDAVMAFWGPPFVGPDQHARMACASAGSQLAALEALRGELPELTGYRRDVPAIDIRIGIATGEVVIGNLGSDAASNVTVIGDAVNIAARLEKLNRTYGTRILLDAETVESLDGAFETREIDRVTVKGKTEFTGVFEMLGPVGSVPAETLRLRDAYAIALAAYHRRDWERAEAAFADCLQLEPADGPAALMLKRCRDSRGNPP